MPASRMVLLSGAVLHKYAACVSCRKLWGSTCASCNAKTCTACRRPDLVNSAGRCGRCKDAGCKSCHSKARSVCLSCSPGYIKRGVRCKARKQIKTRLT